MHAAQTSEPSPAIATDRSFGDIVVYYRKNPSAKVQLLAMHGVFRRADDLAIIATILPEVELLTVDLPGHGEAPHSPSGYSPEALAKPIRAAVQTYRDDRPLIILGESFSGLTALQVARLEPGIRRVVLIDTPFETQRMANSWAYLMTYYFLNPDQRPMVAGICRDFYGLDIHSGNAEIRNYYEYLRRCPVPVTMITGQIKVTKPPIVGAFYNAADLAEIGKVDGDFSVVEIPRTGHSVLKLQPKAVSSVIKFLISRL